MVCADFHRKTFYCGRQKIRKGAICYELISGDSTWELSSSGSTPLASGEPTGSIELILTRNAGDPGNWHPGDPNALRDLYREVRACVSPLFGTGQEFEITSIAQFVFLTYFHQYFEAMPTLHVNVSRSDDCQSVLDVLRNLCYNGHCLSDECSPDAACTLIERYTPSLIFTARPEPRGRSTPPLLEGPNLRNRVRLEDGLVAKSQFSPRIVVSPYYVPSLGQTLDLRLSVSESASANFGTDYASMKADLLRWACLFEKNIVESLEKIEIQIPNWDIRFPFAVLSETLVAVGAMTDDEYRIFVSGIEETRGMARRDYPLCRELTILSGLDKFIEDEPQADPNGLLSLHDFCEYINLSGQEMRLTENAFSRLLNHYRLVSAKPVRKRVKLTKSVPGSVNYTEVQRTFVKIDQQKLKNIIRYHFYE